MQTRSQITGKNENSNPEIVYDNRFISTYWIQNSHQLNMKHELQRKIEDLGFFISIELN